MPILANLQRLLDGQRVPYEVHTHRTAMTAAELAVADHVPPSEVAKTVVLRSGDRFLLAVLPATRQLDLERLRALADDPGLGLAKEADLGDLFPTCELGAIPPIGDLWGLPVWVEIRSGAKRKPCSAAARTTIGAPCLPRLVRIAKPAFGAFSTRTARGH